MGDRADISVDDARRTARVVKKVEREWRDVVAGGFDAPGDNADGDAVVRVTNDRITIPPGTTTTGTSSTTTTTTTTCVGAPPSVPLPDDTPKYLYPAQFESRVIGDTSNAGWWTDGEFCYVQEVENRRLGIGCRYVGKQVATYFGLPVIAVEYDGPAAPCAPGGSATTAATSTTCACVGKCSWHYDFDLQAWIRDDSECGDVAGCICAPPRFCPDSEDCANTKTHCIHGVADDEEDTVYCTTTESPEEEEEREGSEEEEDDEIGCTGCVVKYIPELDRWLLITNDCGDGVVCGDCDLSQATTTTDTTDTSDTTTEPDCTVTSVPCLPASTTTEPPPPEGCGGTCVWVWPDIDGQWWIDATPGGAGNVCVDDSLDEKTGFYGDIPCVLVNCGCEWWEPLNCIRCGRCYCDPPSVAGSDCGSRFVSNCTVHGPFVETGDGCTSVTSSTTTFTTTTPCVCDWKWDSDLGSWVSTFAGGDCFPPLYDGVTDCDVAETYCAATTTTTTSATTTTTTTTTLPQKCEASLCYWKCTDEGWAPWDDSECTAVANADLGCQCSYLGGLGAPTVECGGDGYAVGDILGRPCQEAPSSTTTTTTPGPCASFSGVWRCDADLGWQAFAICPDGCSLDAPAGSFAGGPCSPPGSFAFVTCT
jgi:hypothetical protein